MNAYGSLFFACIEVEGTRKEVGVNNDGIRESSSGIYWGKTEVTTSPLLRRFADQESDEAGI